MSAKYSKQDGYVIITKNKMDKFQEEFISQMFDQQCDVDEEEAKMLQKQRSKLLNLAFIRLILFPVEWFLTRVLVGDQYSKVVANSFDICYKFIKGKITTEEFIGRVK
jgi:hypothetical protein